MHTQYRPSMTSLNHHRRPQPAPPQHPQPASGGNGRSPRLPEAVIRPFNEENPAHEDLYLRARHSADLARHAREHATDMKDRARTAYKAWQTARTEHPDRRWWLPAMAATAFVLLLLDSVAAFYAAEALGGDTRATLIWGFLFLVILGLLEVGLAWSSDRNRKVFRLVEIGLVLFAVLLALLRFAFFAVIGTSLVVAFVSALLFTTCTVLFVAGGYVAWHHAEPFETWRARRHAHKAANRAASAETTAVRKAADRDRSVHAYVAMIRPSLLGHEVSSHTIEELVRKHLVGEQPRIADTQAPPSSV